jgi:NADPH:quinone reductase-like Zn-dependent oxidoreductase
MARGAGARVTATVRSEALRDDVAALGANVVAPDAWEEQGPFDVILELVGAPNLPANVKSLATRGRIVVIGISAGAKAELNLGALMGTRGRVMASTLRARPLEEKALTARGVERNVLPLVERGDVKVPVHSTYALADAVEAYDAFAAGGKLGKIVLTP